jgi:rRNA-processing protein FCF1
MEKLMPNIPTKEEFQKLSEDERTAILQLKDIKKAILEGLSFAYRFTRPISPLVISELKSKGYIVKTEERQIPEKYYARHGIEKTRYNTQYFITIE